METLLTNLQTSRNLPWNSFLPKCCKLIKNSQVSIIDADGDIISQYQPVFTKELAETFDYDPDFNTHVYAAGLIQNGKSLCIFEQDRNISLSLHHYQLQNQDLQGKHCKHQQSWLIRDYDYTVSIDGSFVVMFNSEVNAHERDHRRRRKRGYGLGDKVCISLLSFNVSNDNESFNKANFQPNSYILQFSGDSVGKEESRVWKYRHGYTVCADNNTIVVSTWGVTRDLLDDEDLNDEVLFLDFFSVNLSQMEIKHIRQIDLSSFLDVCPLPIVFKDPTIICNGTMDKILIKSHEIVFMVKSNTIVKICDTMFEECYWINDKNHGEAIISIDQSFLLAGSNVFVKVFRQCTRKDDYQIINDYSIRDLFNHNEETAYFCHGISNGDVYLYVEPRWFKGKIYLIDPFAQIIKSCLVIPNNIKSPYIRKVVINRADILVIVKSLEKEIVCVYQMKETQKSLVLKELCASALLQVYSLSQIKALNLPKDLQMYLGEVVM